MKDKSLRIRVDTHKSELYKNMCDKKLQSMSVRIRKLIEIDLEFNSRGEDLIEKINTFNEKEN